MKSYISQTKNKTEQDYSIKAVQLKEKRVVPFVEGMEWQESPDGFPMIKTGQGTFVTMKRGDYITLNVFGRIGVARKKVFEGEYVRGGK